MPEVGTTLGAKPANALSLVDYNLKVHNLVPSARNAAPHA